MMLRGGCADDDDDDAARESNASVRDLRQSFGLASAA
jgi:hypothetical protein